MNSPTTNAPLRALVTGSTSGVGLAVATRLARRGYHVFLNSRTPSAVEERVATLRDEGFRVDGLAADLSTRADVQRLVEQAAETMGGLDLLCVNTGRPPQLVELGKTTSYSEWMHAFQVQFSMVAYVMDAAHPHLLNAPPQHAAVAIVTSSTVKQPMDRHVYSTVPRTAATALMKAYTRDDAWTGIRLNAVAPVSIATDTFLHHRSDAQVQSRIADTPLGRLGSPDEYAATVEFALDPASHFQHGQTLFVDGGYRWALV